MVNGPSSIAASPENEVLRDPLAIPLRVLTLPNPSLWPLWFSFRRINTWSIVHGPWSSNYCRFTPHSVLLHP